MSSVFAQRQTMPEDIRLAVVEADRLRTIASVANDVLWDIDLATGLVWWSEGMLPVFGYGPEQVGPGTDWCHAHIHPDDRERVASSMQAACDDGSSVWQSEFRYLRADGSYADVQDRGAIVRDESGTATHFMGAMQDVSARRALEARQEILARELAHRVSNTLAIVQGLLRQTARYAEDAPSLATALSQRVEAMANATACLVNQNWEGADLESLARGQLGPFLDRHKPQILLNGPKVSIGGECAQGLALAFNELATNAIKHGALSNSEGRVSLAWTVEEAGERSFVSIAWQERDGPPCTPPATTGLGTLMIERGIAGAEVTRTFAPEGLTCVIRVPLARGPSSSRGFGRIGS